MPLSRPKVINGCLQLLSDGFSPQTEIVVGAPRWYEWLEKNNSFYYDGAAGTFSASKEKRPGGRYWYAYRKMQGKLRSAYLGCTDELGYARLEEVAARLVRDKHQLSFEAGPTAFSNSLVSANTYLTTKVCIPPGRSDLVKRPGLLARLVQESGRENGSRLILISAPAGYGKTTLLSEWAAGQPKEGVAWLSLDESDNEPGRFWSYFLLALERAYPGLAAPTLALLQAPNPPGVEEILTRLLNALTDSKGTVRLVLDDYHLITNGSIEQGLTFLVEHLPPRMHLLIASRRDPALPLARLRVRDQLLEIRTSDLRFDLAETADFLNRAMHSNLAESEIAALTERTEGWVAGLQLAALALRAQNHNIKEPVETLPTFSGNHQHVVEYLAAEVLAKQSQTVQDFLLQTSIVERLNPELGEALTGQKCWLLLRQLEQANLFLIRLDNSSNWYRYHHLFAEFLLNRLRESDPARLNELHRRASRWYEANGLTVEAVSHALSALDYETAARLIEQEGLQRLMAHGEVGTLAGWLEKLPPELVHARPHLLVTLAWVHLFSGQLDIAEASLTRLKLETGLTQTANELLFERACPPDGPDRELLTALLVTQATLATRRERNESAISLAKQALDRLPAEETLFRSAMFLDLGSAYSIRGDMSAARAAFEQAIAISRAGRNLIVELVTISRLGYVERECGRLQRVAWLLHAALGKVTSHRPDGTELRLPIGGLICGSFAPLLYEWNDLAGVRRYILETLELSPYLASKELAVSGYFGLAMLALAEGQPEQARQLVEQAEELRASVGIKGKFGSFFAARCGQIYLALGDLAAARQLLEEKNVARLGEPVYEREDEQILLGRLWLAEGHVHAALDWFERLHAAALTGNRVGKVWLIQVLQVKVLCAAGRTGEALNLLAATLQQTEAEGYVRLYLDEGQEMAGLLHRLADHNQPSAYLNRLLAAFARTPGTLALPAKTPGLPVSQSAKPSLSHREMEVLALLTDQENDYTHIAGQLVISPSTLKKHLHRIYARLGAKNRRQAVSMAIENGLVEAPPS